MSIPSKHILLVDDEPGFLFSASIALRKAGYRVSVAGNGVEALARVEEAEIRGNPVDLMVMDIQMPRMSGLELLDTVRKSGPELSVCAITSFGDATLLKELNDRGCRDYIEKPFAPTEFVGIIGTILSRRGGRAPVEGCMAGDPAE